MKKGTVIYMVDIGLVVTFLISFITGIIKFPGLLQRLNISPELFPTYEITVIHDWSSVVMGVLVLIHLGLHWKWIVTMTEKMGIKSVTPVVIAAILIVGWLSIYDSPGYGTPVSEPVRTNPPDNTTSPDYNLPEGNNIFGKIQDTALKKSGSITIDGTTYEFDPENIERVRKDIFKEGHFSIFAILVYLDNQGAIDLKYHYDASMDTHVIDSLNNKENWWYTAYYSGGWPEDSVHRMDFYPYKDKMVINIRSEKEQFLEKVYKIFKNEVKKRKNDEVMVSVVIIQGIKTNLQFENVTVTAHNVRNDVLQNGVITALDVILSLADQGLLTYDLQWYDTIGRADVKSYWVNRINEDASTGRCGFVYETGAFEFRRFQGNHIHIPSDVRVIVSPEYVEFFWICL